ncbi:unnamed protein product [Somion occarium]|uniref:Transferase n=1 Tax=Somion occarium TaxID=3059160 RepID=A0ABP1D8C7_9APHY
MAIDQIEEVIKPMEPTILGSQLYYELLPTDLLIGLSVETLHVIPGPLETSGFLDALSKTLSVYPLSAGRFEPSSEPRGKWKIRLTNSGVPLKFLTSNADQIMPDNRVIQNQGVASLVEKVNVTKILRPYNDEPLARFTIIYFVKIGYTAIGFSQYHPLGDGYTVIKFLRHLSQNYQRLPELDPPPSYDPPYSPTSPYLYGYSSPKYPRDTLTTYNLDFPIIDGGIPPLKGNRNEEASHVVIHFNAKMIENVHKAVLRLAEADKGDNVGNMVFSKQDTLIALLVRAFTISDPDNAISDIVTLFMFRGIGATLPTAACNALLCALTDPPSCDPMDEPIESVATRIRLALQRMRDPEFLEAYAAKVRDQMQNISDANIDWDLTPQRGQMFVNSTWRFDWTSPHFGYPSQTQFFHTILQKPRYLKIVQPNPTRLADGSWKTYNGDAEVTFSLLKNRTEIVYADIVV